MKDPYELLTPSQKKLLSDHEQWLEDTGGKFDKEWDRNEAIYAIMERFPTEKDARKALENGGYPAVLYLYSHDKVKKVYRSTKKNVKSKRKCKCK
jgi:hypothetical protein